MGDWRALPAWTRAANPAALAAFTAPPGLAGISGPPVSGWRQLMTEILPPL